MELCLVFKESPAYPVSLMIKDYHSIYFKEGEGDYQPGIATEAEEESKLAMIDESGEPLDNESINNRAVS